MLNLRLLETDFLRISKGISTSEYQTNLLIYCVCNTHVKRLSLSASVVNIIITRLLATTGTITQYFNYLLLYNFTTSPLKIDEPLSTVQCCHSWLGTFGNWYEFLTVDSFWICVSSDTLQVGERLKLYKKESYAIKSNEYLDWCTLIFLWKRIIS